MFMKVLIVDYDRKLIGAHMSSQMFASDRMCKWTKRNVLVNFATGKG